MTDKKPILNRVKQRCLILSPTVKECLEREASKADFYREGDRPIGKGGFGEVWKVIHKATNKVYCIKVINKRSIIDQKMVDQMNREIEIMYSLHHPHIVKLVNHFEDDDSFYLVMTFASKGQLYTHLKRSGRFDQRIAAQYLRETIEALRYLHSFKPPIIHRDIKPENILLDEHFRVKLADFGWSNYENSNSERKTYCGTPEYLAPEMLLKKGHDTSVDIWSVGVLMFELLCGTSPFAGSNQDELFNNIRKHRINWPPDFPPLAKNLVSKILKQNPKERISLEETLNHMWFEQNPPIYKPLDNPPTDKKELLESHLLGVKPETCQKEISKIVEKINNLRMSRTTINNNENNVISNTNNKKNNFNAETNFNELKVNNTNDKLAQLTKENLELKKHIEVVANELSKSEQQKQDQKKTFDQETLSLKNDLDKYIKLNKERINTLAELEEKNNKLLEQECKLKSMENEIQFLKENNESLKNKNDELKSVNTKLEEKNSELKRKLFEANSNNENIINDYQKKLELLQMKMLEGNSTKRGSKDDDFDLDSEYSKNYSNSNGNNNTNNLLEFLNENINDYKKIFKSKIDNLVTILTEIKEEFQISEKTIRNNIDIKHNDLQELINKLYKKLDEETEKITNIDNIINNNSELLKKNNKENWLSDQIKELLPYKNKFLNSEVKTKKYENEITILNDRFKTVDNLYNEVKKINTINKEELKLKEEQLFSLENRLGQLKNFVYNSCPEKLDELSVILKGC
jgi:aurora kinase